MVYEFYGMLRFLKIVYENDKKNLYGKTGITKLL